MEAHRPPKTKSNAILWRGWMRVGADRAGPGRAGVAVICVAQQALIQIWKYIFHFKKKEERSSPDLK